MGKPATDVFCNILIYYAMPLNYPDFCFAFSVFSPYNRDTTTSLNRYSFFMYATKVCIN